MAIPYNRHGRSEVWLSATRNNETPPMIRLWREFLINRHGLADTTKHENGTIPPPNGFPDRNGERRREFLPFQTKAQELGRSSLKQPVLLNAWKGKNSPSLVPDVPIREAVVGSAVETFK